jgi:hypothetical protein
VPGGQHSGGPRFGPAAVSGRYDARVRPGGRAARDAVHVGGGKAAHVRGGGPGEGERSRQRFERADASGRVLLGAADVVWGATSVKLLTICRPSDAG